jgi:tetratricopeptide (TPR) repeat protein
LTSGRLGAGVLLAAAFALGTTKIEDTDAWTHLALGREIVRRGAFPPGEPFTFPSAGTPFYNPEWLFDVVFYLGYAAAGFVGVILVKAALSALLFLILWKDSGLPRGDHGDRLSALMIRTAVLLGCLLMIRPRLVERPDLALMIFLGFTIYALNAYLYEGRRYLYWLPVIQLVWVNVQPSILVGMVPFVAFLAGGGALELLRRWRGVHIAETPSVAQLKTVAAVFAAVLGVSLINPHGVEVLMAPFRLTSSTWHTAYILELAAPDPRHQPGPFVVAALLGVVLLATARRLPVPTLLLVAPFLFLGLSTRRFGYLLALVAAPIVARHAVAFASGLDARVGWRVGRALAAGGAFTAVAATALAVGNAGPFADARKVPGFGINDLFLPEQALRYLDRAGVEGRVFNTFHWGGYLAWRDFPTRLPIIDGRGHVEPGLLWEIRFARHDGELLERLHQRYGFDIAVLAYPAREPAEPNAFASPQWALVHWDDVALVYARRSPRLATLIARDEYREIDPTKGVDGLLPTLAMKAGAVEAEIQRSLRDTPSSIGNMLLGFVKLEARAYDDAIQAFRRVHGYSVMVDAAQGLAMAHWRQGDVGRAVEQYEQLVAAYPTAIMLYNLGLALSQLGKHAEAVPHLERAREHDPKFVAVYPVLMQVYRRLGQHQRAEQLVQAHATAVALGQAESHLQAARRLTREGKSSEAAAALETSLRLNPRNPYALSHLGDVLLEQGRLDDALTRHQAALQLDPGLARAHYGLARVYEQQGDPVSARRHFERYLRLEPASYQAWTVRRSLSQPPGGGLGSGR